MLVDASATFQSRHQKVLRRHPPPPDAYPGFWAMLTAQAAIGERLAALCLRHGKYWGPSEASAVDLRDPPRRCFENAALRALRDETLSYVEGYACTEVLPLPIHHAWLVDPQGRVLDPTWESLGSYLGLVFPTRSVLRLAQEKGTWGVLTGRVPESVLKPARRVTAALRERSGPR